MSNHTSYIDEVNPNNNYTENSEFHIYLTGKIIAIQDLRAPDNILLYEITQPAKKNGVMLIYEYCINKNSTKVILPTITIYKKNNKLNLMVSNEFYSQVFKIMKNNNYAL